MILMTNTACIRLPWFVAMLLASFILLTGATWYSTSKPESRPVGAPTPSPENPTVVGPPPDRSNNDESRPHLALASTFAPFLNVIPFHDGTGLIIYAHNPEVGGTVTADVSIGGGSHRGWTMTYSDTIQAYEPAEPVVGFTPNQDEFGDMFITASGLGQSTEMIDFKRAFVKTSSQTETIHVDDFTLKILNSDTFTDDIYILTMSSTNIPPGALPIGYSFAGNTYNVKASGAVAQSDKIMTLELAYQQSLPNNSDPHTLAVLGWDASNEKWDVLGGELFVNDTLVILITQRFRIYALATTPTWRDSFQESSLPGVSTHPNTQWFRESAADIPKIILTTTPGTGAATSIPITPTNATHWGTLNFSATITPGTELVVDLLDAGDNVVMANLSAGADLSAISLTTYPSLKLRATLTSTTAESPKLHEWQLSWQPKEEKIYLPLILKNQS